MIRGICILLVVLVTLTGCSNNTITIEGYITNVTADRVIVSTHYMDGKEDYSLGSFQKTKKVRLADGKKTSASQLQQGHYVKVIASGNINQSLPFQTEAYQFQIMNSNEQELINGIQTALTAVQLDEQFLLKKVVEEDETISIFVDYMNGTEDIITVNKLTQQIIKQ